MKDREGAVTAAKQIGLASFFRMLSTRKIMPATKLRPRNSPATMPTLWIVLIVSESGNNQQCQIIFDSMPILRTITLIWIIYYDW